MHRRRGHTDRDERQRIRVHRATTGPIIYNMAPLRARLNDVASGLSVGAYLVTVPIAVPAMWHRSFQGHEALVHGCLVALVVLWAVTTVCFVASLRRIRAGHERRGGFAWLAGALLSISSLLVPSLASAAPAKGHHVSGPPLHWESAVGIPLALVAKRKRDELVQLGRVLSDESIDEAIDDLRKRNDGFLHALRCAIGDDASGTVFVPHEASGEESDSAKVLVAVPIAHQASAWVISFATVGTRLVLPDHFTQQDLEAGVVALHERGRVLIGDTLVATLRHLVLREHSGVVVVHVGPEALDDDIAAQCVVATCRPLSAPNVMVRLLQPQATVEGVEHPLDPDLRRKCLEMLSYLSVHPEHGVSGDRLRARVLGSRSSDASVRTLNNTASALRRSLGNHLESPRLAPVGASGLYRIHDVACDVTEFLRLVEQGRSSHGDQQRRYLLEALSLIRGEPLVAEPRGYEWFLAEGHYARVLRSLEFAVVTLLETSQSDRETQWRARDAIGRFDPFHVLAEGNDDASSLRQL